MSHSSSMCYRLLMLKLRSEKSQPLVPIALLSLGHARGSFISLSQQESGRLVIPACQASGVSVLSSMQGA